MRQINEINRDYSINKILPGTGNAADQTTKNWLKSWKKSGKLAVFCQKIKRGREKNLIVYAFVAETIGAMRGAIYAPFVIQRAREAIHSARNMPLAVFTRQCHKVILHISYLNQVKPACVFVKTD